MKELRLPPLCSVSKACESDPSSQSKSFFSQEVNFKLLADGTQTEPDWKAIWVGQFNSYPVHLFLQRF